MSEPIVEPVATPEPAEPAPSLLQPATTEPVALADGEWLLTSDTKGIGDRPDFMLDKFKSLDEQAKSFAELEKKFGGFTGAPDEYALNMPDGFDGEFDKDSDLLKAGIEFAKDSNMSQEGFDKMLCLWVNDIVANQPNPEAEKMSLGPQAEQRISQVTQFLQNNLDADKYAEISPLMTTADNIKIVEILVNATAPKTAPINGGSNPEGVTASGWEAMMRKTYDDGPHKGQEIQRHDAEYRKECRLYGERLHGTG